VRVAALLILLPCAAVAADSPGTQTCAALPSATKSPAQLKSAVVEARLAAIAHWRRADGESLAAEGCEKVYWNAYTRLAELNTDAAGQAAAQLLLDRRLNWDAGDALTAVDITARLGTHVRAHLAKHVETSVMAKHVVECIDEGRRSCL
jgi:hypothetical protein